MHAKPLEDITREEFARYERVRRSGKVNMRETSVEWRARIDQDTHLGIITHYTELKTKFPGVRKE